MKIADLARGGKWLAVWWLLPLWLTLGTPGYWASGLLIFICLCVFLSKPTRAGALFLWMPLAAGSAIVCGVVLMVVLSMIGVITTSPPNSAGPWAMAMAMVLVMGGPVLVTSILLAAPILIATILVRPRGEWRSLGFAALANTVLLFAACQHVARHDRGASYFATMPKLVKVTHNPPLTPEEKVTARWLDAFRSSGLNTESQMPIDFYGIVLDENGKPLQDVEIRYTITPIYGGTDDNRICYSGPDGRFEIRGQHGIELFFLVHKDGYLQTGDIDSTRYSFVDYEKPNFYVADQQNPAVIHLTQRPAIEPLTIWRGKVPYLKAEEKFYLDPKTGQTSTQPFPQALWISISPELESGSPGQKGSVRAGMAGGTIAPPSSNSNDYAPESGYIQTWERDNIDGNFLVFAVYFKTRTGNYGQLWIRGQAMYFGQQRPIDYEIFFNPSGSRVLRRQGF